MPESRPNSADPVNELAGERRFQLLVEGLKDYAVYLLDADGIVRSWNAGAERFKGYMADEIVGQHFSRFYTEEDRASGLPQRALRTALEEGKFEAEGWRVRKDGSHFWTSVLIDSIVGSSGELIGFAKVTRDITHQRDARQALFESEQRFRLLVEGVRDYAMYMLDPQGHITNWNAGAAAIKGYVATEIVGQHFSRFYTVEDQASGEPARALQTALHQGKYEREAWRVRKNGTRFWASVLIDPIYDERGTLLGFAKITRDITERLRAQEKVEQAQVALLQGQKMEAIGRLTGGVAHDFNNLLTVIRGSAELLRKPGLSDEKRARYVEAIAETADRAALLTGQLLAFSRRQPLRPEGFDAGARVKDLQKIIGTTVGPAIDVRVEVTEAGAASLQADPNQFETAILNMVINARDAMPSGGTITIATRKIPGMPAIRGHAAAQGEFVAVSVRDSGTGIEPGTMTRIFEPFFTTKEVNKGTGLGLSQVYGFAKQSGGDIDVDSVVGQGSTFTLYLPRVRAVAVADEKPSVEEPPDIRTKSILLVEDNITVGEFALSLLTELGQAVTWATNARAALDILQDRHGEFDIVFSDVVMPGLSGIDLGREIRRRWPDLPVTLASGYSHVLAEEGSHGFMLIHKPYSIADLVGMIGA